MNELKVLRISSSEICYQIFPKLLLNFHTPFLNKRSDVGDNSKRKFEHRPDLSNISSESIQFRQKYYYNYFIFNHIYVDIFALFFFILGICYKKYAQTNSTTKTKGNTYVSSLIKLGSDDYAKPHIWKIFAKHIQYPNWTRREQKKHSFLDVSNVQISLKVCEKLLNNIIKILLLE